MHTEVLLDASSSRAALAALSKPVGSKWENALSSVFPDDPLSGGGDPEPPVGGMPPAPASPGGGGPYGLIFFPPKSHDIVTNMEKALTFSSPNWGRFWSTSVNLDGQASSKERPSKAWPSQSFNVPTRGFTRNVSLALRNSITMETCQAIFFSVELFSFAPSFDLPRSLLLLSLQIGLFSSLSDWVESNCASREAK